MSLTLRGLNIFVHEVRNTQNAEDEAARVDKEIKKIRTKFLSKTNLSGYERKKHLFKLLFAKLLGYDVNFGYKEIASLVKSTKYSEKYTGYITLGILVPEYEDEVFKMLKETIKADLYSSNESIQALALNLVGGLANAELAKALVNDVLKLALGESKSITSNTRKKSLITLLRIYRKYKSSFDSVKNWIAPLTHIISTSANDLSVLNSAMTLIEGVVALGYSKHWDAIGVPVVKILSALVVGKQCSADFLHYMVPHPWLQVKALKILGQLTVSKDPEFLSLLNVVLAEIVSKTGISTVKNKKYTEYSILFEAINVIIRYKRVIDLDLQYQVLSLVVMFLDDEESNVKYLALDAMTNVLVLPGSEDALKEQLNKILAALNDLDVSIRRRALDLLYLMCNNNNVGNIIEELLNYSENTDMQIKEELVLKIAILAEKFAPDLNWYIDVVIRLLTKSGDYITDDIWWRVCQIVTGFGEGNTNTSLQRYAVAALMNALLVAHPHENLVKLGTYMLAEFGLEGDFVSASKMFSLLNRHYEAVGIETKCMLFDAYAKIAGYIIKKGERVSATDDETKNLILTLFEMNVDNIDVEIQKRAFEYSCVLNLNDPGLFDALFKPMPAFHESVEENNPLLSKMIKLLTKANEKDGYADPTIYNQGKKLIKAQMEILKAKPDNTTIVKQHGGNAYSDLFIDPDMAHIKFSNEGLFNASKHRMALKGKNIMLTPENIILPKYSLKEFRNLLINDTGVLYQDNKLQVNYKSEFSGPQGRSALQFVSLSGPIKVIKADMASDGGLKIQISPIKESDTPQIMLNAINFDLITSFPVLQIFYTQSGQERTLSLTLPIFIHKFMTPVTLEEQKYMEIYSRFSLQDQYFKLDEFIKNPSKDNIPLNEVMKKIGALFNNVIKLKALPYPNMQNIKLVYASGQIARKADDNQVVNVVVEVECFEENKEFVRLSIRSSFSAFIVQALYQIITFFLSF